MKKKMIGLMACFLAAGILTAGQAVCSVSAEEKNVATADGETEAPAEMKQEAKTEKGTEAVEETEKEEKEKSAGRICH